MSNRPHIFSSHHTFPHLVLKASVPTLCFPHGFQMGAILGALSAWLRFRVISGTEVELLTEFLSLRQLTAHLKMNSEPSSSRWDTNVLTVAGKPLFLNLREVQRNRGRETEKETKVWKREHKRAHICTLTLYKDHWKHARLKQSNINLTVNFLVFFCRDKLIFWLIYVCLRINFS